jgi:hypothetical protein
MGKLTLWVALALSLSLAGCGSGESPFVGTWSFTEGTDNVTCPTGNTSESVTGNVNIKDAVGGGLVVLDSEGCNFNYSASGNVATASNATCSRPAPEVGMGVTAEVTYSNITLSLADDQTMNDVFAGSVSFTSSAGKLDCTFSGSAKLKKVAN